MISDSSTSDEIEVIASTSGEKSTTNVPKIKSNYVSSSEFLNEEKKSTFSCKLSALNWFIFNVNVTFKDC